MFCVQFKAIPDKDEGRGVMLSKKEKKTITKNKKQSTAK